MKLKISKENKMDVSEKELKFSDKIVLKNASFSYQKDDRFNIET